MNKTFTELLKDGNIIELTKQARIIMDDEVKNSLSIKIDSAKNSSGIKIASAALQGK